MHTSCYEAETIFGLDRCVHRMWSGLSLPLSLPPFTSFRQGRGKYVDIFLFQTQGNTKIKVPFFDIKLMLTVIPVPRWLHFV